MVIIIPLALLLFLTGGGHSNFADITPVSPPSVPPAWSTWSEQLPGLLGLLWPNATVVYELHPNLSPSDLQEVRLAMEEISSKTCINFRQRRSAAADEDQNFTLIHVDDGVCGAAHSCRIGGQQHTKFGGACRNRSIMTHELMHTLCFGHEHQRRDRDDYVSFEHCNNEAPPKMTEDFALVYTYPYDYYSVMHYPCGGCGGGGKPRMSGVSGCGYAPNNTSRLLGVMDADKINARYDCQGCFSHRWRLTSSLTTTDISNMITFDDDDDGSVGICRGYVLGNLVIGTYAFEQESCYLRHGGQNHILVDHDVQLLVARSSSELRHYSFVDHHQFNPMTMTHSLVAAGLSSNSSTGYVGLWTKVYMDDDDDESTTTRRLSYYGTVWEGSGGGRSLGSPQIYFRPDGEEYYGSSSTLYYLVCNGSLTDEVEPEEEELEEQSVMMTSSPPCDCDKIVTPEYCYDAFYYFYILLWGFSICFLALARNKVRDVKRVFSKTIQSAAACWDMVLGAAADEDISGFDSDSGLLLAGVKVT